MSTAERLVALCRQRALRVTAAESCTGGLVSAAITAIPGSSEIFDFGFVTYANAAKTELVGVKAELIAAVGAVSEEVARAMAEGARSRAKADLAVAITGIAGPGGGSAEKPVGTVWFGLAKAGGTRAERQVFPGDRAATRAAATEFALNLLINGASE